VNNSVNGNRVLLEYEDVPAKLVGKVRARYNTIRVFAVQGGNTEEGEVQADDVVETSDAGGASAVDREEVPREAIFSSSLEAGKVSDEIRAEFEDAKTLMPIAKCTSEEWCALCHWCGGRQSKEDRCSFDRRGRKEWFLSYQGVLLLMHRHAAQEFDAIQSSLHASRALKRKLLFLVHVFNAQTADITMSEVNPSYLSARLRSMMDEDGFRMNVSSLKTLLTSFRIYFNVARMESAQKLVAVSAQRGAEQALKRSVEFNKVRELDLFQMVRKRKPDVLENSSGEDSDGEEAEGAAGNKAVLMQSRKGRYAAGLLQIFSSHGIEIEEGAVLKALTENSILSAQLLLERAHWANAVFKAGGIVDAKYSHGKTYYRARIVEEQAGGKFLIEWEDGDAQDLVKRSTDFQFPRIDGREWKAWVDNHHVGPFPTFPRPPKPGKQYVVTFLSRLT
jgi:hypothetical protein